MNTKQITELKEQAEELINCGNSKEKSEGYGMMRVIQLIEKEKINPDKIAIIWQKEDIEMRAEDLGIKLTIEEIRDILHGLKYSHDATLGINWDVIDSAIETYQE